MISRALLLVAFALALPLPVWAQSGALVTHAAGVTLVSQSDSSAALVGVEFTIAAGLDRERLRQDGLAALVAQSVLETPSAGGVSLSDAIAAHGGSVAFTMEAHDVRFYVEALATDAPAVLALFERAAASPDFSAATVRAARDALMREIAGSQQEPLQVGIEMLDFAQANGGNSGLPLFGTPASLVQLAPADASAFYRTYYRRGGSSISAVGRVDALGARALESFATMLPVGATAAVKTVTTPLHGNGHELVARRSISAPWLVVRYGAPSLGNADYGPMLVLAAFLQRTLSDIGEIPGTITPTLASRAVGAEYNFDRVPGELVLYVDGAIDSDPNRTFGAALSVVNILSATRLQGSIAQFKTIAAGDFATRASTLEARAWLGGAFTRRTGSADYLRVTLRAIAATTPGDLQRVARRYLASPTIALVLPRTTTVQN
ncbi:MAG TPA: insulinase family protein [Candidatus Tyrphobacter sp.]